MEHFAFKKIEVGALWDEATGSWQYVVSDRASAEAVIIDPVLDYDPLSASTSTSNADRLLSYVSDRKLEVKWVLDTHPHADHLSAAHYLGERLGSPRGIGERVVGVQELWSEIYCWERFPADGSQWDRLFADGDSIMLGDTEIRAMFSPGHTLASVTYVSEEAAFVHDTLMMPDSGTARADFPGGSSRELYHTIRSILDLADGTSLFIGHDYGKDNRGAQCCATVAEHLSENIHMKDDRSEGDYVRLRDERDATLSLPKQMLAALQVNLRGGRLPDPEGCGRAFLKIPLNYFDSSPD